MRDPGTLSLKLDASTKSLIIELREPLRREGQNECESQRVERKPEKQDEHAKFNLFNSIILSLYKYYMSLSYFAKNYCVIKNLGVIIY